MFIYIHICIYLAQMSPSLFFRYFSNVNLMFLSHALFTFSNAKLMSLFPCSPISLSGHAKLMSLFPCFPMSLAGHAQCIARSTNCASDGAGAATTLPRGSGLALLVSFSISLAFCMMSV